MANVIKLKRGSGSDPGASDLVVGEIALRTDTGKIFTKKDNGTVAEISGSGGGNNFKINTISQSNGTGGGSATFNGSAYRFTLSDPPGTSCAQCLVSVNGVIQKPVAGTSQPAEGFAISGNDILFSSAPASGADYFIVTYDALSVTEVTDNSIDEGDLKISNAGSNGQFLQKQSGNTGGLTWATVDLSSKLNLTGGTLTGDLNLGDEDDINMGAGVDLKIYSDGSTSFLKSDDLRFRSKTSSHNFINCFESNGLVQLFHSNNLKLATASGGVTVTGTCTATTFAGSGASLTSLPAGQLTGTVAAARLDTATTQSAGNNSTKIATTAFVSTAVTNLIGGAPGALDTLNELAAAINDDSSYASTVTTALGTKMPLAGGTFTGSVVWDNASNAGKDWKWNPSQNQVELADDVKLVCGDGDDLEISFNGTYSLINSAGGYLQSRASAHYINNADNSANFIRCESGLVSLHHNNSKRIETTSAGVEIDGKLTFAGDGHTKGIELGADADILLYHDNSNAYFDNNVGHFYIRNDGNSTSEKIIIQAKGGESNIECMTNGGVDLYYDNFKTFETTSIGCKLSDNDTTAVLQFANSSGDNGYVMGEGTDIIGFKDNQAHWLTKCTKDGSVELYFDNAKKFETTSAGCYVTGRFEVAGAYSYLSNDSNSYASLTLKKSHSQADGIDYLQCRDSNNNLKMNISSGGYINFAGVGGLRSDSAVVIEDAGGNEWRAKFHDNGKCEFAYDNNLKFETLSSGAKVWGDLHCTNSIHVPDSQYLRLGDSQELKIWHDSNTHSYITESGGGGLAIGGSMISLMNVATTEYMFKGTENGSVEIYHDNTKVFETVADGAKFTSNGNLEIGGATSPAIFRNQSGAGSGIHFSTNNCLPTDHTGQVVNNSIDLGSTSYRWRNLYINDLQLSNEGSQNSVDGTWGDWTLQEGEEDIFMINNRSGKKYKMALQEVS